MPAQTDPTAKGQIQFIQNHQTALNAGEYKIEIKQTVTINNSQTDTFNSNLTFVVQGSRFELNPQDVHSVFPPAGSSGDHSHVLPHIVLKRSTLPWEREAESGNQDVAWLALIVIYEEEENVLKTIMKENIDEISINLWEYLLSEDVGWLESINDNEARIVDKKERKKTILEGEFIGLEEQIEAIFAQVKTTKVIPLKNLTQNYTNTVKWNAITLELGQHEDDNVSVIDINKKFLSKILPTTQDLEYLAHVRQVTGDGEDNEPLAVIISNRLPKKNGRSTAYLVSFEERYTTIIVDADKRKIEKLQGKFLNLDAQVKEYLGNIKNTNIIKKEDFLNHSFKDNNNEPKEEEKKQLWDYLLSSDVGWLQSIFDYQTVNDTDYIRLVTLKNWSFSCSEPEQNFKGLLKNLNLLFSCNLSNVDIENINQDQILTALKPEFEKNKIILSPNAKATLQKINEELNEEWTLVDADRNYTLIKKNQILIFENKLLFSFNLSDQDIKELNQNRIPNALKSEFEKNKIILSPNAKATLQKINEEWTLVNDDRNYTLIKKNQILIYDHSSLLRLPQNANIEAEKYLAKGYVPLPHYLRQGGKTYSWYHSPLLPGENPTALQLSQLSIRCADQLIAYDSSNGLFDISYAAAWQLGQLLALQDKKFAVSLFNWKRTNAQNLSKDNQQARSPHLFATNTKNPDKNSEFPEDVKTWLERLGLLYNIPFNYLVPDETMLPIESIRFFWLDWFWLESLLDGAFSIGRVQDSDLQQDSKNSPITGKAKQITGFLMRSEVVSGWIDLQVDGSNSLITTDEPMQEKLDVLRCDRLSEDVLICLFDGEIKTVDISLKPEGLHFGFNNIKKGNLEKKLRNLDGTEVNMTEQEKEKWTITYKEKSNAVIDINELANNINEKLKQNNFTSAHFALQMVQGAEKVRFVSNG